ncbi:MAG: hypothetical protein MJ219_02425 [Mycoplasmoidaceae bacterium]|nr:hypothetical protein [Mycoplasmoidaceae bacterium]
MPSFYCFPTIRPLSSAKIRGLRDKLPIGTIRSREILSMKEVYFEPDE